MTPRTDPQRRRGDVSLEIGEGLPQVFQITLGTPEAAEATEQIGKFLLAQVLS